MVCKKQIRWFWSLLRTDRHAEESRRAGEWSRQESTEQDRGEQDIGLDRTGARARCTALHQLVISMKHGADIVTGGESVRSSTPVRKTNSKCQQVLQ